MIRKYKNFELFVLLISTIIFMSLCISVNTSFDVANQLDDPISEIDKNGTNFRLQKTTKCSTEDKIEVQIQQDVIYWDWVQLSTGRRPRIHNDQIVWCDSDGNDLEIYLYDGTQVVQITNNEYNDYLPEIHNGMVTWVGHDGGTDTEIFLYDGSSIIQLSNNEYFDSEPQIHNGMVTWVGHDGHDSEIFFYDGVTMTQLSNNGYTDYQPQIHDGLVVWDGFDENDREIYLYDGTQVVQITNNDVFDQQPSIHNGKIVWIRNDPDEYPPYSGVYSYDGFNEELVAEYPSQLTYRFFCPKIHNDLVVYLRESQTYLSLGLNEQIFYRLIGIVVDPEDLVSSRVHNGIISWYKPYDPFNPYPPELFITDHLGNTFYNSKIFSGYVSDYDLHNGNVTWESNGVIYFLTYDNLPPRLSNPDDFSFVAGSIGNSILWEVGENNPDYCSITLNGDVIEEKFVSEWGTVEFDMDYFTTPGIYNVECTVYDILGYSSSDEVVVTVLTQAPTWGYEPYDTTVVAGTPFVYQLVAIDTLGPNLGFSDWWITDTTPFSLTAVYHEEASTAYITNTEPLIPGEYEVEVTVTDFEGYTLTGSFTVNVVSPFQPANQLELKLSGSFDYLEKEDIHLQLAGLLTDSSTGVVIRGATVTFEIYNPDGIMIISGTFVETNPGIYIYKADDTIKNLKDTLHKEIYWVSAHAQVDDGREAVDMIQFHIDPPNDASISISPGILPFLIGIVVLLGSSVGGFYFKRKF